jgi:hypothetical protein
MRKFDEIFLVEGAYVSTVLLSLKILENFGYVLSVGAVLYANSVRYRHGYKMNYM